MKINVNSPSAAPPLRPHTCAHCGVACSGAVQVFLHIADNPPDERPRVNVISQGFAFCNPDCRAAWWETETTEALVPTQGEIESDHTLGVTLFHVDPHSLHRAAEIVDHRGHLLAVQKGDPVAHFRCDSAEHLEAWWRGEVGATEVPLPLTESP